MTYRRRTEYATGDILVDRKPDKTVPTVSNWTGLEAKLLRAAMRLTVNEFAATLGINPRTVNKWEARQNDITPLPEMQAALDTTLCRATEGEYQRFFYAVRGECTNTGQATLVECGGTAQPSAWSTANGGANATESAGTVDHGLWLHDSAKAIVEFTGSDMATRREFLELSLLTGTTLVAPVRQWAATVPLTAPKPEKVGSDEINELERAVALFRSWDAAGTGGLHRKAVVGQLNAVAEIVRRPHAPRARSRLLHVAAELAQLAGWMTFDAGLCGPAQRYFLYALRACQVTDSDDLAAKVVGDLAQVSNSRAQYDDSLAMVRTALGSVPRGANPLVRSELLGHQAYAYARLGPSEVANACRSVESSVEAFDQATEDSRTGWNQYMDRAEVECLAGSAYIRLALDATEPQWARSYAQRAETHVQRSLRSRGEGYSRSRLFDEVRMSKVRLAQREPVEAAEIARNALGHAERIQSSMAVSRLVDFGRELVPRYGDVSGVAEFRGELVAYVRRAAPERA